MTAAGRTPIRRSLPTRPPPARTATARPRWRSCGRVTHEWRACATSARSRPRAASAGCQGTPVASIATCVTRYPASRSRDASNPRTVVENPARGATRRPAVSRTGTHARHSLRLVQIERADALNHRLHRSPPRSLHGPFETDATLREGPKARGTESARSGPLTASAVPQAGPPRSVSHGWASPTASATRSLRTTSGSSAPLDPLQAVHGHGAGRREVLRGRGSNPAACVSRETCSQLKTVGSHTPAATTVADSSMRIERPIARSAWRVESQAGACGPSRRRSST